MTTSRMVSPALAAATGVGLWSLVIAGRVAAEPLPLLMIAVSVAIGVAAGWRAWQPPAVVAVVAAVGVAVTVALGNWLAGVAEETGYGWVALCVGIGTVIAVASRQQAGRCAGPSTAPTPPLQTLSVQSVTADQVAATDVIARFVELFDPELLDDDCGDAIELLMPLMLNESQIRDIGLQETVTLVGVIGYVWRCAEHDTGLITPPEIEDHLQAIVDAHDPSQTLRQLPVSERALVLFRAADACIRAQVPLGVTSSNDTVNGNALLHVGLQFGLQHVSGTEQFTPAQLQAMFRYGVALREAERCYRIPATTPNV